MCENQWHTFNKSRDLGDLNVWLLNVTISLKHINDLKKSNIEINVREINDLKNSPNVFTYFHVVSQIVTYRQHITSRGNRWHNYCVFKKCFTEKYWYTFIYAGRLIWVELFMQKNHLCGESFWNHPQCYDFLIWEHW